jgi:soluble lytic murein transglycosylase-like protein
MMRLPARLLPAMQRLLRRRALPLAVAALAGAWILPSMADVWAYVDANGESHFATEQLDARYELFFRSSETFDTRRDPPPPEPTAVTAANLLAPPLPPTRLLALFDASPSFTSVRQILRDASSAHDIDYELLQALIATESGFNASAVSPKGAIGLMQLMPDTARRYGVDSDRHGPLERKLTDPKTNVRAGTRYLRDLINMFPGQLELALAAYNAGEGAVMRAGNQIPNYKETQNYVKNVLGLYWGLKPPAPPVAATPRYPNSRVRPAINGGALNRGNLPSQTPAVPLLQPDKALIN